MKKISDLLQKFSQFGLEEKQLKQKVIEITKEKLSIELNKEDFEIMKKVLKLKISGVKKTEIVLNKRIILNELGDKVVDIF